MEKKLAKIVGSRSVLLAVALVGSLAWTMSTRAHDGEEHGQKAAATAIPSTAAAIWQSVDKETEETAKAIQTGALKELHHHAFAIRDLVAALPDRSGTLPAAKLEKVKADGKFIATLAGRLDAAGDSNNKAASVSNFEKLKEVLKSIRSNYPDVLTN